MIKDQVGPWISWAGPHLPCLSSGHAEDSGKATGRAGTAGSHWAVTSLYLPAGLPAQPFRHLKRPIRMTITACQFRVKISCLMEIKRASSSRSGEGRRSCHLTQIVEDRATEPPAGLGPREQERVGGERGRSGRLVLFILLNWPVSSVD